MSAAPVSGHRSSPSLTVDRSSNDIRVLILHSRYSSGVTSGENRVVEDETELLRRNGVRVTSWTPEVVATNPAQKIGLARRAIWSNGSQIVIRRLIDEFRPSVAHVHNLFPALSPAIIRTLRQQGIPVVMTLHNYRLQCLPATLLRDGHVCTECIGKVPWRGVYHRCYRDSALGSAALASALSLHRALGTFDDISFFLPVSNFIKQQHEFAGLPPEKMRLRPNFAWPSTPREGAGSYFLYLGRLTEEKGILDLVRRWSKSFPLLRVVGEGPLYQAIDAQRGSNVQLEPAVTDVQGVLKGARATILPSQWLEPAGRVILEAAACAVPSIVTNRGGMEEFVQHGATGLVVNAHETALAVNQLCDDETSLRLGRAALDKWETQYSPAPAFKSLMAIYSEALDPRASP